MRRLAAAAALLYSAAHFAASGVKQPHANFYSDFLASFPAWGMAFFYGRLDLYDGSLASEWGPPPIWHYGPMLHALATPLLAFPTLKSAYVAWLLVNYVFVVLTAILAVRVIDDGRPTLATAIVVVCVFCNFNPLYEALTQRNIELFELLLLFAAFLWLRKGRDTAAGIAVGTAAMAKFLPLIFLPWFVLKRKWDALGAALLVIFPVVVVTEFVLGWENSGILMQLRRSGMIVSELDQSLAGIAQRLFASRAAAGIIVVLALIALCALMLRVRHAEDSDDLEWGILVVAMVLLPPHNEQYYFVFLLMPYLFLYARYRARWSWRAVPAAVSFLLVAVPLPFSLFGPKAFSFYLQAGIPFIGAALLAAFLVWELSACPMQLEPVSSHVPRRDFLESQHLPQQP